MKRKVSAIPLYGLAAAPSAAGGLTLFQVLGFLDIVIGLFVAASIVIFAAALIVYFVRLGQINREEMFPYMEFSIATLFVISVVLGLIRFFREYTDVMLYILGAIAAVLIAALILWLLATTPKKEEGGRERRR